jgi:hypothetical protein
MGMFSKDSIQYSSCDKQLNVYGWLGRAFFLICSKKGSGLILFYLMAQH